MATYRANAAFFRSRPFEVLFFGWLIFPLLYWFLLSKTDKVVIEDDELLYEHGILSKNRTDLKLKSIRAVKVKQRLMDRILGSGDIEVYTSGDAPEVVLRGFPNPKALRNVLRAKA